MSMSMMNIWKVRVTVPYPGMLVRMCVGLFTVPAEGVRVPMMLIVCMRMRMRHRLMNVLMLMLLGYMQPDTDSHADRGKPERIFARCTKQ